MSEAPFDLIAQLQAHLHSLRAAGILMLPRGAALDIALHTRHTLSEGASVLSSESVPTVHATTSQASSSVAQPAPDPTSPEGRRRALALLAREIGGCDLCGELFSTRTQTVFGSGPVDPEVAFVGEAPGADEDREGLPFVGRAGQLLTRIITRCGFARPDVYIMNTLKCRPPNNRQPNGGECANCWPYFERQFELVQPKYVVALGATAAKNLLKTGDSLANLRGRLHEYRGRPLVCTYHPSALLRDDSKTMWWACWEDMKLLLKTMGRPIPDAK